MKQRAHAKTPRAAAIAFISALFSISLSTFPLSAAADVVGVQTKPLIPGNSSCLPLTAHDFTPYVYDGALHSFEFTIPDRSYVALTGAVGGNFIPFQYMTRGGDANTLRVHVDTQSIPIKGLLPISVTLISAKGGQQSVCMSTVLMTASLAEGKQSNINVTPSFSTRVNEATIPSSVPTPPVRGVSGPSTEQPVTSSTSSGIGASQNAQSAPSAFTNLQNNIVRSCMVEGGAVRLWITLLAIFIVITAIAVLSPPSTYSKGQRVTTIIIPLILLLTFWYMTESCRGAVWAPATALVIAALGILALYWNDPRITGYTDQAKKITGGSSSKTPAKPTSATLMITPPPSEKK